MLDFFLYPNGWFSEFNVLRLHSARTTVARFKNTDIFNMYFALQTVGQHQHIDFSISFTPIRQQFGWVFLLIVCICAHFWYKETYFVFCENSHCIHFRSISQYGSQHQRTYLTYSFFGHFLSQHHLFFKFGDFHQ